MSKFVKRRKYEDIKDKASQWRDKALDYQERNENLIKENEQLIEENDKLQDNIAECPAPRSPDHTLEDENTSLRRENKSLGKKIRLLEDKNSKEHFELERQLLRKEGEVDRLNASLEDYKERYKEFRDEVRQTRRDRVVQ